MSNVHVNTRRTLADLGMRDTARGLSYGCAIRGFVHADNAPLPQSSPPHDFGSELGRSSSRCVSSGVRKPGCRESVDTERGCRHNVYMTNDTCKHGFDCYTECSVDEEGHTSCCGAFSSIFADDGTEYCKCCYGSVTGGHVTERHTFDLS